jgi:excisionase family DNA binding protein
MRKEWFSVDEVAERLGLHVRTVRGYVRDGRLRAVRIGKQYRITAADLDEFTGRPPESAPRAEVSAIVELDGVSARTADRLSTFVVAGAQRGGAESPLRVRVIHDDTRGRLKLVILGELATTADILRTVDDLLRTEDGHA